MSGKMTLQEKLAAIRAGNAAAVREKQPTPESALQVDPDVLSRATPTPPSTIATSNPTSSPRKLTLQEKLAAARSGAASVSMPDTPSAGGVTPEAPPTAGRPLTLQEKLAAARSGGTPATAPPPVPSPRTPGAASGPAGATGRPLTLQEKLAAARVQTLAPVQPASAASDAASTTSEVARPLSLKEKLAAARAGGTAAPAAGPAPGRAEAPSSSSISRVLPPLAEMTDPRDLAEALRRRAADLSNHSPGTPEPAEIAPPPFGRLVLPYSARDSARQPGSEDRVSWRAGLTVVAGVILAWVILVGGLAGIGYVLLQILSPNLPA